MLFAFYVVSNVDSVELRALCFLSQVKLSLFYSPSVALSASSAIFMFHETFMMFQY